MAEPVEFTAIRKEVVVRSTKPLLVSSDFPPIHRYSLETLQINLGYRCNQRCLHCHVNAGPTRTESMSETTAQEVIRFLAASGAPVLDITGGAPEMHAVFPFLVREARQLGVKVIDRCNLTILEEPGQEKLAEFLAENRVEIVASLPCYLEENVNRQRGGGVFEKSISALRRLNELGYGDPASGLVLNLVYNPQGPVLPPPQQALEADYKRELGERYGVRFNRLFTLANMPIQRFGSMLISRGQFGEYMNLLRGASRPENLETVMCRTLLSVDWQGFLFDCDFNQMLALPIGWKGKPKVHISELMGESLDGHPIVVGGHCYGCTAGQGSSCGGALS
ncbi:MAG: arsenosugar biosynthesis radical SAM protein ArsS [Gammaproteobacteria bacterium]